MCDQGSSLYYAINVSRFSRDSEGVVGTTGMYCDYYSSIIADERCFVVRVEHF